MAAKRSKRKILLVPERVEPDGKILLRLLHPLLVQELAEPDDGTQTTNYGLVLRAMWEQLNAWAPIPEGTDKAVLHAKLMDGIAELATPATELDALIAQEVGG